MQRLSEQVKIDIGLVPQAINNGNATGKYFSLAFHQRVLAILLGGAMAATKTSKVEFLQAKDADGTDSKAVTGAEATVTANVLVTKATVDLTSVANTDVVTINGVSFTKAASTVEASRTFADAAGLVSCVNDATYGVPGVVASANGAVVTLQASDPGAATITLSKTENAGTITLATVEAQAYVELDTSKLDVNNGFTHVAVKVTTTANTVAAVLLQRYDGRFGPDQKVGASAIL